MEPTIDELKAELKREKRKSEYGNTLRNTLFVLLVVAAGAVLISSFFISVLKITGESMTPVLESGQVVIARNSKEFKAGELIAFYYNNKVLVKRVIASPGEWVDIDKKGNVSVNGTLLPEDYLKDKSLTPTDIKVSVSGAGRKIFRNGGSQERVDRQPLVNHRLCLRGTAHRQG
jgi:signal peptidase I